MIIAVPREVAPGERRIALVPEAVKRLVAQGFEVWVENAPPECDFPDAEFEAAGARIVSIQELYEGADMVVGSKRHPDSTDARPWLRRQGTAMINLLLRATLEFEGTDTHGLKAFRRAPLLPVVESCHVEHNLFASELVIRAGLAGLDVQEIPLCVREIRPPSVGLVRRVPQVLGDLARLVYIIRVKK